MKPRIFSLLLLLCLCSLQKLNAQLTVFGGAQMSSAQYSINGAAQKTSYKTGFMGGAGLKTSIEGPAYFAPMLFFSRKGYDVVFDRPNFPPDSGAVNNNTVIHTIELAPLIQFNLSKKASYAFLRIGPSFDFNLSGREVFDSTNGKRIRRDMRFSFSDYSHGTISMNAHIGFQHKRGFTLFAFATMGVSSLNNADLGPRIYHRVGGIAAGWQFGKKG